MPPEMYDEGEDGVESGEGRTGGIKLFADEVRLSHVIPHEWSITDARPDRSVS